QIQSLVDRFAEGTEMAKSALGVHCPEELKSILESLEAVLDFLAQNYLYMVSNKVAAAKLGLSCASAAQFINELLLGDLELITQATLLPAIERFAELLVNLHDYVVKTFTQPERHQEKWVMDMKSDTVVGAVKSKLDEYSLKLVERLSEIDLEDVRKI
ncbi:hypothetical protein HK405_002895, partial [Cladochytrium tenue]